MDQKKAFWDLFFEVLNTGKDNLVEKALDIVAEIDDQRTAIAQITHAASQFSANPDKSRVTKKILKILEEKALKAISQKQNEQTEMDLDES